MKDGAVKADIVFCTDGECGVSEQWMKEFKDEQEDGVPCLRCRHRWVPSVGAAKHDC